MKISQLIIDYHAASKIAENAVDSSPDYFKQNCLLIALHDHYETPVISVISDVIESDQEFVFKVNDIGVELIKDDDMAPIAGVDIGELTSQLNHFLYANMTYYPVTPAGSVITDLPSDTEKDAWEKLLVEASHMPYKGIEGFMKRGYTVELFENEE